MLKPRGTSPSPAPAAAAAECRTLRVPGLSVGAKQVTLLPAQLRRLFGRKRQSQLLAWELGISKNPTLLITTGPGAAGRGGAPESRRPQRPAKPPPRTCGRLGVALGSQHMGPSGLPRAGGMDSPSCPDPLLALTPLPRGLKDTLIPLHPFDLTENRTGVWMMMHETETE